MQGENRDAPDTHNSTAPEEQEDRSVPQLRLDTMEFRPSDARKGEFERIPF